MRQLLLFSSTLSRSSLLRLAGPGMLGIALILVLAPAALAQRYPVNPVENLRQELLSGADNQRLELALEKLTTPGQMASALILQEWRSELVLGAPPVDDADRLVRRKLASKFEAAIRAVFARGTAAEQEAAVTLLGEISAYNRKSLHSLFIRALLAGTDDLLVQIPRAQEQAKRLKKEEALQDPPAEERRAGLMKDMKDLLLRSSDPQVRMAIARTLGRMTVVPGVPATDLGLTVEVDVPDRIGRTQIIPLTLKKTEPLTISALRFLLVGGSVRERRVAAEALGQLMRVIGPSEIPETTEVTYVKQLLVVTTVPELVPAASQGLKDSDAEVRRLCAEALLLSVGAMIDPYLALQGDQPEPGVGRDRKREPLDSGYYTVITTNSPRVQKAYEANVTTLEGAINDPDLTVRLLSRRVVEELGILRGHIQRTAPPPPGPAEEEQEQQPPPPDEGNFLKDRVGGLVEALIRGLSDPAVSARLAAIDALELLGLDALRAAPNLSQALCDPDRFVRWAAARVLGKLADRLTDQVDAAWHEAQQTQPGSDERKKAEAKLYAARAKREQALARYAVPGLACLLSDDDLDVRVNAALALQRFGDAARSAVSALAVAVNKGDVEIRTQAIRTLEAIGPDAAPAIPALIQALRDENASVRREAAGALGYLGPVARSAVDALVPLLNDRDPDVRRAASAALLAIQPPPR